MSLLTRLGSGLSFAHLGARSARAENSDPDDDQKPKGRKAAKPEDSEPSAEDDQDDVEASGSRAEGDGEIEDDPEDEEPSKKAKAGKDKSGKGGDEDDDEEEEMRGSSAAASARRRERARCAAIFATKAAGANPALAAHLAFNTTMTRSQAIGALEAAPAAAAPTSSRAAHPGRSAQNPNVTSAAAPSKSQSQQISEQWERAFAAVGRPLRGAAAATQRR